MSLISQSRLDDFTWQSLGACVGLPGDVFFELYENDEDIRDVVTAICGSCPVKQECLTTGVIKREYGVWGGQFLKDGKHAC